MATFDAIYGLSTAIKYLLEDNYPAAWGTPVVNVVQPTAISATSSNATETIPDVSARMALGALRFVDPVTGQSVTEGLSVIAHARNKAILATPSTRGVHIFHQLSGMSAASYE
jgi:hypothetical protein